MRFITNRSSGKMGFAVAEAARDAGAEVITVSGPVSVCTPRGRRAASTSRRPSRCSPRCRRESRRHRHLHRRRRGLRLPAACRSSTEKIKKTSDSLMLALSAHDRHPRDCGRRRRAPFVVGFAAETQNVERNALAKLEGKNLDMIAANQVGEGLAFDQDDNALTVYWRGGERELARAAKCADRGRAGRAHRRAFREPGERRASRQPSGRKRRGALIRLDVRDSIEAAEPAPSPGAGPRSRASGSDFPLPAVRDRRLGRPRPARLPRCAAHARARRRPS